VWITHGGMLEERMSVSCKAGCMSHKSSRATRACPARANMCGKHPHHNPHARSMRTVRRPSEPAHGPAVPSSRSPHDPTPSHDDVDRHGRRKRLRPPARRSSAAAGAGCCDEARLRRSMSCSSGDRRGSRPRLRTILCLLSTDAVGSRCAEEAPTLPGCSWARVALRG